MSDVLALGGGGDTELAARYSTSGSASCLHLLTFLICSCLLLLPPASCLLLLLHSLYTCRWEERQAGVRLLQTMCKLLAGVLLRNW